MVLYYCPLKPGAWKSFSRQTIRSGAASAPAWRITRNTATRSTSTTIDRSTSICSFRSELTWKEHGLAVRQETRFPEEDATHLTLTTKSPVRVALKIRYPGWAQTGMIVTVNGKPVSIAETRGSYATIDREWTSGDRVDIRLPMTVHTEAMPDNPKMIAVMYGPIVLAGDLGREGLGTIKRYGPSAPQVGRVKTPTIPVFIGDVSSVPSKVAPVSGARLHFVTDGLAQPHEVSLVPLYQIVDQRYTVYWKVLSSAEWTARKTELAGADARRKDIDQRAIDTVIVNDANSERDHAYKGENASEGYFEGRRTREARGGWFSYVLKVPADRPATLVCTYRGSEGRRRSFVIIVDGEKIAAESLEYHPTEELDREYAIPESLTRGKDHVTVRFEAQAQSTAGALLEIRTGAVARR